jgi:hypothetical protein
LSSVAAPIAALAPPTTVEEIAIAAPNGGQKKVVIPSAAVAPMFVNTAAVSWSLPIFSRTNKIKKMLEKDKKVQTKKKNWFFNLLISQRT